MTYHYDTRDITEYMDRMKTCYQFTRLNILPLWAPGTEDVDGFIHDEVVRQYHDPRVWSDGGVRIRGMKQAWSYAQSRADDNPGMDDLLALGVYVEPSVNSTMGFRYQDVYIGNSTGAPPGLINEMVIHLLLALHDTAPLRGRQGPHANDYRNLWKNLRSDRYAGKDAITRLIPGFNDSDHKVMLSKFAKLTKEIVTADDWYMCYEAIHPFGDGNGRTGKILNNWLLGSLDEPILVDDYFGGGNP